MEEYICISKKYLEDRLKNELDMPIFTDEQDSIQTGTVNTLEDILRRGINLQPIIEDAYDQGSTNRLEHDWNDVEKYIKNLKIK